MPAIKTSLYDGAVNLDDTTLDLSGRCAIVNNGSNIAIGATVIAYDNGLTPISAGDKIYGVDSVSGSGELRFAGTVDSVTQSGSAGSYSGNITLTAGSKISFLDNEFIINSLPKFEIVAIQIAKSGALSDVVPVTNNYPGHFLSNGVTAWSDDYNVTYYGAADGAAGVALTTLNFDGGVILEGRWKKATMSDGDSAICYLKAVPSKSYIL
tara:strand:- start:601 stop:1230 length:630 start_codon:yes stop_codon:yes gene_type:complete